jgi:acetyl-CoA carboxylase biotin carboxyl carrier protein
LSQLFDLEFLQSLIRALDESSLDSVEIERGGTRVRLSKTAPPSPVPSFLPVPQAAPVAAAGSPAPHAGAAAAPSEQPRSAPASSNLIEIKSPMVGTFFRAPAPDAPPYVDTGSRVKKGDTLCIIEAMKLMNELECEVAGTIAEVCVENAEPVEYGQVLFRVEPA